MSEPALERRCELMRHAGVDVLVLTGVESVVRATGHRNWVTAEMRNHMINRAPGEEFAMPSVVIMSADGRTTLVAPAWFAGDQLPIDFVRTVFYGADPRDNRNPASPPVHASPASPTWRHALQSVISSMGVDHRSIGFDDATGELGATAARCLDIAQPRSASVLTRLMWSVKTEREIDMLRSVATINEEAGRTALEHVASGGELPHAANVFRVRAAELGADFEHFMYSERGAEFATVRGRRRSAENEALAIDWGCALDGFRSDSGHTVVVGDVPDWVFDTHAALYAAVSHGATLLRPGSAGSAVAQAMDEVLAEAGIRDANPHGHGLGVAIRDLPVLSKPEVGTLGDDFVVVPADAELEERMVVNLETTVRRPPFGAMEVEMTFVVTQRAALPIIEQPRAAPFGCDRAAASPKVGSG